MSGKVVIAVTAGASQGKTFVFDTHDIFLFGRKDDCHACLPDDQLVSRHHFICPQARICSPRPQTPKYSPEWYRATVGGENS